MINSRALRTAVFFWVTCLVTSLAFAQQTGGITGRVTTTDGQGLPGVTVEARSNVLPQARVTTTSSNGDYRLPALPPGNYTLTFSLAGMGTQTRQVRVLLQQDSTANVRLGMEGIAETITVVADNTYIDPASAEVKSSVSSEAIEQLPTGQEYRDLVKLAPAVQYTEDQVRGPSAGGSGQDNVYQFDGVNVNLPLFGTLSAEPSSHDIDQIAVIRGGARAVDFNRSGGFTIDSVSKSGTNEFSGQLSYQLQSDAMSGRRTARSPSQFEQDRDWLTFGVGGPILRDQLFFYGSYYRPTVERENRSNVYGEVPNFESTRDELFGKLTFTPTSRILLHGSYRDSDRESTAAGVGGFAAATTSVGDEATLQIGILEGSWVITDRSYATFKLTDFANETASRPDVMLGAQASITPGARLDVNNLEQMGFFNVPSPIEGQEQFNAFIAPLIERYGFIRDGVRTGGGAVGAASTINDQDFFRQGLQLGYDFTMGESLTHDIHVGYQWYRDEEDLRRRSNAWGSITVPGGRSEFEGQPIFYEARFIRAAFGDPEANNIHSEIEVQNFEINDTIRMNDWTFNVGVMLSQDTLFGQGLRNDPSTLSGYVLAPGEKYEMYKVDFGDMIQPRLGATWAYNGVDTVYASYAKYNPAATSLPRAASWDRAALGFIYRAYFDEEGNLFAVDPVGSSSGKLFQEDLDPRYVDEYIIGTSRQLTSSWAGRAYARHRYATNFWEDTNNNARVDFEPPPGIPRELYIENLNDQRRQICASNPQVCTGTFSGSTYVIAELDGAFNKYYEVTLESDYRTGPAFVRGSYTWSHYYGNFDQDNTSNFLGGDFNTFIGSSNLADSPGRQIWDNKFGDLRGDRRHVLKVYGYYGLPWNATAGAFAVYQSGQPWEAWSYLPYSHLTRSTSSVNRYAEPAGSRTSDDHYQLDLNYTQNVPVADFNLQFAVDAFNVTDNQTGYNHNPFLTSANFGLPQSFYSPRRYQVAVRFLF